MVTILTMKDFWDDLSWVWDLVEFVDFVSKIESYMF
jgi:hypothetical protein